jgi:C1A family cysteine protease
MSLFDLFVPYEYKGVKLGGYRQDPPDPRDLKLKTLRDKLGIEGEIVDTDLRRYCSPVEDQKKSNSCGPNSTVGALELLENVQGMPFQDLSRLFVYYNARLAANDQGGDVGTYIRLNMASLSSLGVCSEKLWPFDLSKITTRPSWKSYREGYVHRISGYYRIEEESGDDRNRQMEWALVAKHPIVFGVDVWQNFVEGDFTHAPDPAGKKVGGHAMLCVGYNRSSRTFIIRNSWGTDFGDQGYFYCSYDWLDKCNCRDLWVPTMVV